MFIMMLVFTYVHNVVNCFPMFIMMLMFTYVYNDVIVCTLSYRQPRLRDEVVNCLQDVASVQVVVVRVAVVRVAHLKVVQHRFQLAGRNLKCFIVMTEWKKDFQNLAFTKLYKVVFKISFGKSSVFKFQTISKIMMSQKIVNILNCRNLNIEGARNLF